MTPPSRLTSASWLVGGGEMGRLVRSMDWSATALGPIAAWPESLRTTVNLALASNFPMSIAWGPHRVQIYNDGYWPICGAKHPHSMGQDFRECWASAWPAIGEAFESATAGRTAFLENQRMFLDRHGYLEETFFTFSFSPIRDESGRVAGLFHPVTEMTAQTLAERRLDGLREVADATSDVRSVDDAARIIARTLERHALDVPFALLYLLSADGKRARLAGAARIDPGAPAAPREIVLADAARAIWPLADVVRSGAPLHVEIEKRVGRLTCGPYPEAPETAMLLPIAAAGRTVPLGVLIAGTSPRRAFDAAYRTFTLMLQETVTNALGNARAYEDERRRSEALAELDRAKTTFFSNTSHEFRTPLTLMLGPLEDALAQPGEGLSTPREQLAVVHRNALRLLKLVNSLLDFSRIQAGRTDATYEPTDLAALTADLASNFRSACERAGLRLVLDCATLDAPVYVDREMWEKVVLNLLSNAFKFTLEGEIAVSLRAQGPDVVLEVRDTGSGIAPEEMLRLFERFHRIQNAHARTHEGTGIGLALVQELVKLHGGSVTAESTPRRGSTFRVRVPKGSAHLPSERIGGSRALESTAVRADAYVGEALRWLSDATREGDLPAAVLDGAPPLPAGGRGRTAPETRPRVLLADDNADMRGYVARLLQRDYAVECVADGEAALASARRQPPDLVLADVMMPRRDGFALLQALRTDAATRELPVILLSARAGEESRIEGMEAGADDYLVKPFSARELLVRVRAHVQMAALRRGATQTLRESEARLATILEQVPVAVGMIDAEGRVVLANERWRRYIPDTLPSRDPAVGGRWRAFAPDGSPIPPERWPGARALRGIATAGMEFVHSRDDGRQVWLRVSAVPFQPDGERVDGAVCAIEDIDARKRTEESLRRTMRELEEHDRNKDLFLATLGHELRNPLAALDLAVRRIDEGAADPAALAGLLRRNVGQLTALVNDLLEVSRITSGKLALHKSRIDLAAVVRSTVDAVRSTEEGSARTTQLNLPARLDVEADATRVEQIVTNLLSNAVKHTSRGGAIRVDLWQEPSLDDSQQDPLENVEEERVVLTVQDDGEGIPQQQLDTIFEPFTQLSPRGGGLGMGLPLARGLAELHGGSLTASSDGVGCGSTFRLEMPRGDASADAKRKTSPRRRLPADLRVVVVDDLADSADSVAHLLRARGCSAQPLYTGEELLQRFGELRPHAVLLDLGLPGLSGYDVARRLRSEAGGSDVLLVAVTGFGDTATERRALESGFDHRLVKPLDWEQLEPLLLERAGRGS